MIAISSTELLSDQSTLGSFLMFKSRVRSYITWNPFLGVWYEHLFMTKTSKRASDGVDLKIRFFFPIISKYFFIVATV